ncbi:MAG: cysteine--tRNA ligase, partial [Candidatus Ranarchaeia archaeon]
MGLVVYNTLSGKKEQFIPIEPHRVRLYVCGLTVYDAVHLGHARTFISFDMIRRYLEFKGYEVTYVQNITDVDDKLIKRSEETGIPVKEIAEENIREMFADFDELGIRRATYYPRASLYIEKMLEVTRDLIEKGKAYQSDGNVFFDVNSYPEYGKLSRQKLDKLKSGARKKIADGKLSPHDFALWKANKGEDLKWNSPWGDGRPGWHIECTTMALDIFKDTLDIHGGGMDLVFPHHENEIAQSEAHMEKPFAKFWMHTGMLNVHDEKMSKSLKNFITIREYLKKHPPEVFRLIVITHHYRTPVDFNDEKIIESKKVLNRFNRLMEQIQKKMENGNSSNKENLSLIDKKIKSSIVRNEKKFFSALDDDFNTPAALAVIFNVIKQTESYLRTSETPNKSVLKMVDRFFRNVYEILGVFSGKPLGEISDVLTQGLLKLIIDLRNRAREAKDWKTADTIRDHLQ